MSISEKFEVIADAVYDKGLNDGKKSQYDEFWDAYQNYGKLTNYKMAFAGRGWDNETFKPKYDIGGTAATTMFQESLISGSLIDICKEYNIKIHTENCIGFQNMFYSAKFTEIPEIDCRKASKGGLQYAFYQSYNLVKLEKLILNDVGDTLFQSSFYRCDALSDITIEGVIGQDISFSYSPLSVASIESIISALKDYKGTSSDGVNTVTFKASAFNVNSEEWRTQIQAKGWNVTTV